MEFKANMLLADDDHDFAEVLSRHLTRLGYNTVFVTDGPAALRTFKKRHQQLDFCLFDVKMPKLSGLELTKKIREIDQNIPILLHSALSSPEDVVAGLTAGADGYARKPISLSELELRIESMLRRRRRLHADQKENYQLGEWMLNCPELLLITPNGKSILLTERMMMLTRYLAHHPNEIINKKDMLMSTWGGKHHFQSRSMDVYICKLRKIFKTYGGVELRKENSTHYTFVVEQEAPEPPSLPSDLLSTS